MNKSFVADQPVYSSGAYKAIHANKHIPAHYVIALHGETFPN
jgi:hypothetical protein